MCSAEPGIRLRKRMVGTQFLSFGSQCLCCPPISSFPFVFTHLFTLLVLSPSVVFRPLRSLPAISPLRSDRFEAVGVGQAVLASVCRGTHCGCRFGDLCLVAESG